jgi:hypothetical protein
MGAITFWRPPNRQEHIDSRKNFSKSEVGNSVVLPNCAEGFSLICSGLRKHGQYRDGFRR